MCKACSEIKAKEDYIEEERKRKIRDSTPNNGCFNCGTKESNLFFFDYDKENWICDRCYYITNYGEEKWKEILTLKEKQRNEKIYGSIKLFMKEKQFVRIPLIERYSFDDVISYELIENGNIEKSKGIGGAIIGGALAGVPGALIGYDISKKNKNVCTEYKIIIRMKGSAPININYIGGGVPVSYDSVQFNQYRKAANETIEGIELILDMVKKENEITMNSNENQITSIADEIMKLKELLDQGIISEEEFVEGKKKLLQK